MDRAFRSPSPLVMFAVAALIALSTGGCGGGDNHPQVAPAALPSVTVPSAAQEKVPPGPKAATSDPGNSSRDRSSYSGVKRTESTILPTAKVPQQGVESSRHSGSAGSPPTVNLPANGTEPEPLRTGQGSRGPQNGMQ